MEKCTKQQKVLAQKHTLMSILHYNKENFQQCYFISYLLYLVIDFFSNSYHRMRSILNSCAASTLSYAISFFYNKNSNYFCFSFAFCIKFPASAYFCIRINTTISINDKKWKIYLNFNVVHGIFCFKKQVASNKKNCKRDRKSYYS